MTGTGLKAIRKAFGYKTAKDFTDAFGVPQTTYARWEQHPECIPTKTLIRLADWFAVPIDDVVGRSGLLHEGAKQREYDRLSPRGRAEVDRFMQYQTWIDGKESRRE